MLFIATWVPGRLLATLKYILRIKETEEEEEKETSEASSEATAAPAPPSRRGAPRPLDEAAAGQRRPDRHLRVCWAIFSWFIFVCAHLMRILRCWELMQCNFAQVYGMIICAPCRCCLRSAPAS